MASQQSGHPTNKISPRKFSEKIALLNKKEAEGNAEFETIIKEVQATRRHSACSSNHSKQQNQQLQQQQNHDELQEVYENLINCVGQYEQELQDSEQQQLLQRQQLLEISAGNSQPIVVYQQQEQQHYAREEKALEQATDLGDELTAGTAITINRSASVGLSRQQAARIFQQPSQAIKINHPPCHIQYNSTISQHNDNNNDLNLNPTGSSHSMVIKGKNFSDSANNFFYQQQQQPQPQQQQQQQQQQQGQQQDNPTNNQIITNNLLSTSLNENNLLFNDVNNQETVSTCRARVTSIGSTAKQKYICPNYINQQAFPLSSQRYYPYQVHNNNNNVNHEHAHNQPTWVQSNQDMYLRPASCDKSWQKSCSDPTLHIPCAPLISAVSCSDNLLTVAQQQQLDSAGCCAVSEGDNNNSNGNSHLMLKELNQSNESIVYSNTNNEKIIALDNSSIPQPIDNITTSCGNVDYTGGKMADLPGIKICEIEDDQQQQASLSNNLTNDNIILPDISNLQFTTNNTTSTTATSVQQSGLVGANNNNCNTNSSSNANSNAGSQQTSPINTCTHINSKLFNNNQNNLSMSDVVIYHKHPHPHHAHQHQQLCSSLSTTATPRTIYNQENNNFNDNSSWLIEPTNNNNGDNLNSNVFAVPNNKVNNLLSSSECGLISSTTMDPTAATTITNPSLINQDLTNNLNALNVVYNNIGSNNNIIRSHSYNGINCLSKQYEQQQQQQQQQPLNNFANTTTCSDNSYQTLYQPQQQHHQHHNQQQPECSNGNNHNDGLSDYNNYISRFCLQDPRSKTFNDRSNCSSIRAHHGSVSPIDSISSNLTSPQSDGRNSPNITTNNDYNNGTYAMSTYSTPPLSNASSTTNKQQIINQSPDLNMDDSSGSSLIDQQQQHQAQAESRSMLPSTTLIHYDPCQQQQSLSNQSFQGGDTTMLSTISPDNNSSCEISMAISDEPTRESLFNQQASYHNNLEDHQSHNQYTQISSSHQQQPDTTTGGVSNRNTNTSIGPCQSPSSAASRRLHNQACHRNYSPQH